MAINVPIITQFDKKGIDKAVDQFNRLEGPAKKAGFALEKAFVPATVALGGLAIAAFDFAKGAAEDAASADKLEGALRRTTKATEAQIDAVADYIDKAQLATNIADVDLREAFAKLAVATGDVTESQDLLNLAADISVATGKDLSAVTDALAKAYSGNMTALQKLDPSLRDAIKSGADFDEVGKALSETYGGAAADAVNTAEGRFKNMAIRMDEVKETIGAALLPIIERLLPVLSSLASFVEDNTQLIVVLGSVIGGVAGAIVAINVAMKVWTATTKALTAVTAVYNAVLAVNPVVLIVAAVVALIAIFVVLQQKFDIIGKAVEFLGGIFGAVKDFILNAWNSLLDWFRNLPELIRQAFDVLFLIMVGPYKLAYDLVIALWTRLWGWFKDLPGRLGAAVANIFEILIAPFRNVVAAMFNLGRDIVGGIVDGIKSVAGSIGSAITSAIPGAGTVKGLIGKVLPFAEGGLVTQPTLGLVGEAGPEVVIPLDRLSEMRGGRGDNITINVAGTVVSERDLIEQIRIGLLRAQRNGQQLVA